MIAAAQLRGGESCDVISPQPSEQLFLSVSALLFVASAALTVVWCGRMSSMPGMPMPGGWKMSMTWMRMPGETWLHAAASFVAMWIIMMAAMMLPSLIPVLRSYRRVLRGEGESRLALLTALVGVGYFFVWTVFGAALFPLGASIASLEMRIPALARSVPVMAGAVALIAGALQFTPWKMHHLACCRQSPPCGHALPSHVGAWRHGISRGIHCSYCCANLTVILLVIGVMDLRAMVLVTAAITAERLAPEGRNVARLLGVLIVGAGLFLIARATALA